MFWYPKYYIMDSKMEHKMDTGLIQGALLGDERTRVTPILRLATL